MTELTKEQIAQGWKVPTSDDHGAKKGQIVEIYTRAYGSETHFAEDCDLSNSIDYEDDPVGHFNCATLMYRIFSPDVPGPSESDALEALECLHTYALKTAATDSFYETHNQEMNEHMRKVATALTRPDQSLIASLMEALEGAEKLIVAAINFERAAEDFISESEYELNAALSTPSAEIFVTGADVLENVRKALASAKGAK